MDACPWNAYISFIGSEREYTGDIYKYMYCVNLRYYKYHNYFKILFRSISGNCFKILQSSGNYF